MDISKHELVQQWRQCRFHHAPFIFGGDSVLHDLLDDRSVISIHNDFDEFTGSSDFGTTTNQLHLGLLPLPYVGNLSRSDIFILLLNPGFRAGDYYVEQHSAEYRAAILRSVFQENEADEYPFFFLDPRFSWTGGGIWWQDKLRDITQALVQHQNLSYQEALRHISRRVSCLELLPYHSKSYGVKTRISSKLTSVRLIRDFAQTCLSAKASQGEITIIVTRKAVEWGLTESDNTVVYRSSEARAAHLTLGTNNRESSRGGRAMTLRLGLPTNNISDSEPQEETVYAI